MLSRRCVSVYKKKEKVIDDENFLVQVPVSSVVTGVTGVRARQKSWDTCSSLKKVSKDDFETLLMQNDLFRSIFYSNVKNYLQLSKALFVRLTIFSNKMLHTRDTITTKMGSFQLIFHLCTKNV